MNDASRQSSREEEDTSVPVPHVRTPDPPSEDVAPDWPTQSTLPDGPPVPQSEDNMPLSGQDVLPSTVVDSGISDENVVDAVNGESVVFLSLLYLRML